MQLNKQSVLIVDDEKSNLKILSECLKDELDVLVAMSGDAALRIAKEQQPTLIMLDILMPEVDGFDVIKALKSDAATRDIPVIFITGLGQAEFEAKGFELGACDYIHKPFHPAIVQARVRLHLQLARQRQMLEELANIDPLTSLANRRCFDKSLEDEWRVARREGSILSMCMIDVDNFKSYNDLHGHPAGDLILEKVAKCISNQFNRPRDKVARYGGEEFIVLLPNTDSKSTQYKMEQCCKAVSDLSLPHHGLEQQPKVTISIGGVSSRILPEVTTDILIKQADLALYEAKSNGRNTTVWHEVNR